MHLNNQILIDIGLTIIALMCTFHILKIITDDDLHGLPLFTMLNLSSIFGYLDVAFIDVTNNTYNQLNGLKPSIFFEFMILIGKGIFILYIIFTTILLIIYLGFKIKNKRE